MDWIEGVQNAIGYLEDHLLEPLDLEGAAREAGSSPFRFMRMFNALTGFTVAEYVRNRRLTLAGRELSLSRAKVVDIAMKYGYETHEAFTRAFVRFHGISPSAAREPGAELKSIGRLSIHVTLKGDKALNYKLVEKEAFTVVGKKTVISCKDGENYREVPEFCNRCQQDGTMQTLCGMITGDMGIMGICAEYEQNKDLFDYYMAVTYNGGKIPEGMETLEIPKFTWAVFESVGPMPDAIQDVWHRIFSEWFPTNEYEHADGPELEVYSDGDISSPDYKCWVWIPVVKKSGK